MTAFALTWQQAIAPRYEANDTVGIPLRDEATVRVVIPGARVVRSGNLMRLGLQWMFKGLPVLGRSFGYILGRVTVGRQSLAAAAGDPGTEPWDTDAPPVVLTFGGDDCAVVRAGGVRFSDPAAVPVTAGQGLVVSVVLSGHGVYTADLPAYAVVGTAHPPRSFVASGRAACLEQAPRGLVEHSLLANYMPFIGQVEVAAPATVDMEPLATSTVEPLDLWDGVESIPAGAALRVRVPASALRRTGNAVRLVCKDAASSWTVGGAAVGRAGEGHEFAGDAVAAPFAGLPGATFPPGALGRSDAVALDVDGTADLLASLTFDAATAIPRHAASLTSGPHWPWWYRLADGVWTPGHGAAPALAGLEASGAPARPPAQIVYEVLGGNSGARRDNPAVTLAAGTVVRLLLPRQRHPAIADAGIIAATQARVTLFWHDAPWTPDLPDADGRTRCWTLNALTLGFAARPDGVASVFTLAGDAIPVPVAGRIASSSSPLVVDGPLVSDWFDLPRPWTPADRLLLSLALRQPLDVWSVGGGWQALWDATPPATGTIWPGTQPFVRRVDVR